MAQLMICSPHPGDHYLFGRFLKDMLPLWGPRFERILVAVRAPYQGAYQFDPPDNVEVLNAVPAEKTLGITHTLDIGTLEDLADNLEVRNSLSIGYGLIDTPFIDGKYLKTVSKFDFFVTPSYMARAAYREALIEATQENKVDIDTYVAARNMWYIPPAVDSSIFRPLNVHAGEYGPEELRQHLFNEKVDPNDFLILVSGNPTIKKGIPLAIQTIAHLKTLNEKDPFIDGKVRGYLHMSPYRPANTENEWLDIESLVIGNELELEDDILLGYGFFDQKTKAPGLSDQEMNYLYNACDLVLDTSLKNSWNFTVAEAMSAGTLVAGPNDFVTGEIIDGRGIELETSRFEWYPGRETSHTPDSYVRTIDPYEAAKTIATRIREHQERNVQPSTIQSSVEEIANEWLRLMGMI